MAFLYSEWPKQINYSLDNLLFQSCAICATPVGLCHSQDKSSIARPLKLSYKNFLWAEIWQNVAQWKRGKGNQSKNRSELKNLGTFRWTICQTFLPCTLVSRREGGGHIGGHDSLPAAPERSTFTAKVWENRTVAKMSLWAREVSNWEGWGRLKYVTCCSAPGDYPVQRPPQKLSHLLKLELSLPKSHLHSYWLFPTCCLHI